MKVTAGVENSLHHHTVVVRTNEHAQELNIPAKATDLGAAVNGGELLFLARATCSCNDIYREAEKKGLKITKVSVEASGKFAAAGEPGFNTSCRAKVEGEATDNKIAALIRHTDQVAEIQNTLRAGTTVTLLP